ncbi:MAG: glycosyltransferase [Desulfobacterales bacterium]|nr:glycosyltransferase [Desulfobacterales bacterium]MBF0398107.1 glycosyltransferase [Desulfobacterales bacterium]
MKQKHLTTNLILGLAFAVITFAFWALINRPSSEPPWPSSVAGMSFSPYRMDNDPFIEKYPSLDEIDRDIALLSGKVKSIRTYSVNSVFGDIPRLAKKYGMTVTVGAWLTNDKARNEKELDKLIAVVKTNSDIIERVIVGNECLLRNELTVNELISYLDRIRKQLNIPVSTAETWNTWYKNPELSQHVDFVAGHFLPYWEGVGLDQSIGFVNNCYQILKNAYPKLPILIAEVGWPSNGRTRKSAIASEANEAIFLRRFLEQARTNNYDYYLMEAFDQPWKKASEGSVGAYWGIFDVYRNQKFAFTEPIVRVPEWRLLAVCSIVAAFVTFLILLFDSSTLTARGKIFLAITANTFGISMVWTGYDYINQYLTPMTILIGFVLAMGYLGVSLVLLTEAHEWVESSWVQKRRRLFAPKAKKISASGKYPKVSIHIPSYNEPPEMLKGTLNALSKIDYPNFEVLVIDNNTKDPEIWQPVSEHCRSLGERFRFFHVDPLKGYKAGALNYAMANMDQNADIIAVIDSDYQVQKTWLKDLVSYFNRPEIGFVQAPQDYRDSDESMFKAMCYSEYQGFFHIGMVTRNDRNAIIEHGTMTMIRTSVLRKVGGWAEWCITEDAELGLRIFEHGYEGAYVEKTYGKGLMPDTFIDYKQQRYRWAYGAIQILKRHSKALFSNKEKELTLGQRYHFLAGWLPWVADGINLFYTLVAIVWSILMMLYPRFVDPPQAIFMIPPVVLFIFKVIKLIYLYRTQIGTTRMQTVAAAISGLALSHTIAKAVVNGFFTSGKPFFRTPKCENGPALIKALATSFEETCLGMTLWVAALGVIIVQGQDTPGAVLWSEILMIQSLPYVAALFMSIINVMPKRKKEDFKVKSCASSALAEMKSITG